MAGVWDFNCPQFVDFNKLDEDANLAVDEWFDEVREDTEQLIPKTRQGSRRILAEQNSNIRKSEINSKILKYTPKKLSQEKFSTPPETMPKGENEPPKRSTRRTPASKGFKTTPKRSVVGENIDEVKQEPKLLTGLTEAVRLPIANGHSITRFNAQPKNDEAQCVKRPQRKRSSLSNKKRSSLSSLSNQRRPSLTRVQRKSPRLQLRRSAPSIKPNNVTPSSPASKKRRSITGPIGSKLGFSGSKRTTASAEVTAAKTAIRNIEAAKELDNQTSIRRHLAAQRKLTEKNDLKRGPLRAVKVDTQGECINSFPHMLRKHDELSGGGKIPKEGITKPIPFKLTEMKKRKMEQPLQEYRPLAQQILQFEKLTPKRYHTRSKTGPTTETMSPEGKKSPRMTIPKTPNLMARHRHRAVTAVSREEAEEQEWQRIQQTQFKAQPVNPDIFKAKPIRIEHKLPTVPEPFKLTQPSSASKRTSEEPKYEFHARPVPRNILAAHQGIPPLKKQDLTTPKTPNFVWKERLRHRIRSFSAGKADSSGSTISSCTKSTEEKKKPFRPIAIPLHEGVPFKVKLEKKSTEPAPFSFDEKDRERMMKKEEKIREVYEHEKKMREFHARPLPKLEEPSGIPEKHRIPPTELQPFQFLIDNKSGDRIEKWKKETEEMLRKQRELALFKAQPNKVIYNEPFIPGKSNKPLTYVHNVELKTSIRAKDREAFDEWNKQREAQIEAQRRRMEEERERQELELVAKLRKEAVHKANPVRHYKQLEIKSSLTPLTVPQSPGVHYTKK